jgi:secondary thiamine-phosphate synthase enzyme
VELITEHISVATHGHSDVIDITMQVSALLEKHNLKDGTATIFVVGSTASITTMEFEPGLRKDIPDMLERIAPSDVRYHHDDTWGDGNGHAHVRASFLGPSIVVPFAGHKLLLGTWQQIVLIDFDTRSRKRDIVLQIVGK